MTLVITLAACRDTHDPPRPASTDGSTADTAASATGDSGVLKCDPVEGVLDGRDSDCDGWADELGAWPLLVDDATLVFTGPEPLWGEHVSVGHAADGQVWIVGGGDSYPYTGLRAAAPASGDLVTIDEFDNGFAGGVAVGRFAGAASLVAQGHEEVAPDLWAELLLFPTDEGVQGPLDYVAYVERLPESGGTDEVLVTGDLDGDGYDELIDREGDDQGYPTLRILDGAAAGPVWSGSRATLRHEIYVQNFAYRIGEPADVTGDGVKDVPVFSEEDGGRVWLVSGDITGDLLVEDVAFAILRGEVANDDAGWSPSAGDANGDGYLDLLVGAPLAAARRGKSYLELGPIVEDRDLADATAQVVGDWDNDWCGAAQTFLADADGDGADEPAVGCPRDWYLGLPAPGRVQGYRGPDMAGTLGIDDAAVVWMGAGAYDYTGYQLHGDDDVDGDGRADLVVGVPGDAEQGVGAVYLVSGPSW